MKRMIVCLLVVVGAVNTAAGKDVEDWVVGLHEAGQHEDMPYRLLRPLEYDSGKRYPVIISLHGAGGRGTDNVKQLRKWNQFLAEDDTRKNYPCYVLAPQTTELWSASHLSKIKAIIAGLPSVDMDRIYILGHSMGGHGTYKLTQLDPSYFAAAAPSAGSGLASTPRFVDVDKIKDIPFWIFHGDEDPKCPIEFDRKIYAEMKAIGGNMKFTTWKGDKHGGPVALKMVTGSDNGTTVMSSDRCDPEPVFLKWLFSQKRSAKETVGAVKLPAKPNVVVLLSDDLGYGDLGCYDGPVKTPAIDALAAQGVRFTDFYSGAAVCSPSRATLLTGRHHIRTGVYSWIENTSNRSHLLQRETTLAEVLKSAGYATAHFGKWHLGLPNKMMDKPTPADHGFDDWFATENNAQPSHRNPDNFIRNGVNVGKLEGYSCQLVVDEAIGWLDKNHDPQTPFFLNVWFHEPHAPIAAPDELVETYGELANKEAVYSGTIDNTDSAISRLLSKLREIAPAEDTLIIYASDNGTYMADRTGGLRGKKGNNWEGGIRVPGIFCWPGHISLNETESTPAGVVDVLPTVCGLLDLAPPVVHLDGTDLSGLLTGNPESFARLQPLFWHLQKSRPIVAMREDDWSLVADPDYQLSTQNKFDEQWIPAIKQGGYKNYQLFNLKTDPAQQHDLASEMPERVERMKRTLLDINASIMADGRDWNE